MQEGLRKAGDTEVLKEIVSPRNDLSQRRQCELLGLNRSMQYYKPAGEDPANLELMRLMDEEYRWAGDLILYIPVCHLIR